MREVYLWTASGYVKATEGVPDDENVSQPFALQFACDTEEVPAAAEHAVAAARARAACGDDHAVLINSLTMEGYVFVGGDETPAA